MPAMNRTLHCEPDSFACSACVGTGVSKARRRSVSQIQEIVVPNLALLATDAVYKPVQLAEKNSK
jgi:hypothetical protein